MGAGFIFVLKKIAYFGFAVLLLSRLTLENFYQPGGGAESLFLIADTGGF